MNKSLIAALVVLGVASVYLYTLESAPVTEAYSFEQYKREFAKHYTREGEEQYRRNIFLRNLITINEHNANPKSTYTMGVNQFTDLTQAEFEAIYLTLQVPKRSIRTVEVKETLKGGEVDWTAEGKVTAVKNQGACGSCWAFAANAALESAYLLNGAENTINLSEQQLVDCSTSYGNDGCDGGWMDSAFDYVRDKGLTTTERYPYVAKDQACKIDSGEYKLSSYVDIADCTSLFNALNGRPISVAVDATNWSPYKGGVFNNCAKNVNHGVLVVGATDAYWRVKNSWGSNWGESGYMRLYRGDTCAVCEYASYPVL